MRVYQMPFIKSQPNRNNSDEISEEGLARKEELAGEKKSSTNDDTNPDESGIEATEDTSVEMADENIEPLLLSEIDEDKTESSTVIVPVTDEEEILPDEQFKEREMKELDTKEKPERLGYIPPYVLDGSDESGDADTDAKVDSYEPDDEGIDIKATSILYDDVTDIAIEYGHRIVFRAGEEIPTGGKLRWPTIRK